MRRYLARVLLVVAVFLCLGKSVMPVYAGACGGGSDPGCYTDSSGISFCPGDENYNGSTGNMCCQATTGTTCEGGIPVFVCHHQPVDCPAGSTATTTVISSVCTNARNSCNLGTAEVLAGACDVVRDANGEIISAGFLVNTYSCVSTATCTPRTDCSTDHPGYRYTYTPTDYPTCTFGPPWPTWPTHYSLSSSCGSCTPRTDCSTDHPGYRYTYTPTDYPTCTFGPPWPSWPSDYSLSTACGASPTPTPAPAYIRGGVFNDPTNDCTSTNYNPPFWPPPTSYPYGWTPSDPVYNSVVRIGLDQAPSGSYTGTGLYLRDQGGTIQIRASSGVAHTLYLANLPAGYRCSDGPGCPSCPVRTGAYTSGTADNFYITNSPTPTPAPAPNGAWWQAEGAGVYVGSQLGGTTVRSDLPSSTRLILPGTGGTSGVLVRGSGTPSLGSGSLSSEGWSALASYRGKRMDYNYFSANMGVLKNSTGEWTLNNEIDLSTYPSASDFAYRNGDGYVVDPITVASGESYVVFVNGNLSIEANITVANGGFLAFIVNGVTTVSPSVQTLQGIYVSDDDFVTERFDPTGTFDDVALDVEGTVVTWGNFELGRELGILNSTTPAEKFSYRSDFLTNMPDKMKTFAMEWQEVAAGSFE